MVLHNCLVRQTVFLNLWVVIYSLVEKIIEWLEYFEDRKTIIYKIFLEHGLVWDIVTYISWFHLKKLPCLVVGIESFGYFFVLFSEHNTECFFKGWSTDYLLKLLVILGYIDSYPLRNSSWWKVDSSSNKAFSWSYIYVISRAISVLPFITNDDSKIRFVGRLIFGKANVFIETKGGVFDRKCSNVFIQPARFLYKLFAKFPKIISDQIVEISIFIHPF